MHAENLLYVPCGMHLTEEEKLHCVELIAKVLKEQGVPMKRVDLLYLLARRQLMTGSIAQYTLNRMVAAGQVIKEGYYYRLP